MAEHIYDPEAVKKTVGFEYMGHTDSTPLTIESDGTGEFNILVEVEDPALKPTVELTQPELEEHGAKVERVHKALHDASVAKKIDLSPEEKDMMKDIQKDSKKGPHAVAQNAFKMFMAMGKRLDTHLSAVGITEENSADLRDIKRLMEKKQQEAKQNAAAKATLDSPKPSAKKQTEVVRTRGGYTAVKLDQMIFGTDEREASDPHNLKHPGTGNPEGYRAIKVQVAKSSSADALTVPVEVTYEEQPVNGITSKRVKDDKPNVVTVMKDVPVPTTSNDENEKKRKRLIEQNAAAAAMKMAPRPSGMH